MYYETMFNIADNRLKAFNYMSYSSPVSVCHSIHRYTERALVNWNLHGYTTYSYMYHTEVQIAFSLGILYITTVEQLPEINRNYGYQAIPFVTAGIFTETKTKMISFPFSPKPKYGPLYRKTRIPARFASQDSRHNFHVQHHEYSHAP